MFEKLQDPLAFVGRLLLAVLFLPAGIGKLTGFAGTVGYIAAVGLPLPQLAAALALVVEIVGGAALVAGYGTRLVAIVLAAFTLVASFFFHNYWVLPADQQMIPQLLFFKNIAVVGGLLTLAAWGAGAWSVDARREQRLAARRQNGLGRMAAG
ncbi:MAG TPA: DoxX family protein [Casimicrobiaceae bacterium]|nr:DoxX family protein [Casimicrobiaceae bacterium]